MAGHMTRGDDKRDFKNAGQLLGKWVVCRNKQLIQAVPAPAQ